MFRTCTVSNFEFQHVHSFSPRFFCPPPCLYLFGQGWNHQHQQSQKVNAEEGDKESQIVAFIGISSGNHGDHEYQQLSMEDRLVDKVSLTTVF